MNRNIGRLFAFGAYLVIGCCWPMAGGRTVAGPPVLRVTGLSSHRVLGEPIRFAISISNPGPRPLTIVALTQDMVQNGSPALTLIV
jgi:hypothetical protein